MLELINLCKDYPTPGSTEPLHILRDVNLAVKAEGCISVVGPSGSGKSTLLNVIGGLDTADSGRVVFNGTNLQELSRRELAQLRNQQIGFVFQLHHLLPQCTVLENVLMPTLAGFAPLSSREALEEHALELIRAVGLGDYRRHRPGELSVGQRQRVALARALINEPKLLLADEPTGSLDADTAEDISELLVELNDKKGLMLIVVTHSMSLAKKMNHVYELKSGNLIEKGH